MALVTVDGFSARAAAPVSFEIDRVSHTGTGAEQRTGFWITDASRTQFVFFSDNDNGGGWQYNLPGTSYRNGSVNIVALDPSQFNDLGNHRVKLLANGSTVKFYVDDAFGAEASFPVSNGIHFAFGAYARTSPDTLVGVFDNARVIGPVPAIQASLSAVILESGQTNSVVSISIPRLINQSNAVQVTVSSSDPAVAIPVSGTAGVLTLTFPAGAAPTQSFEIARVGKGSASLSISNLQGLCDGTVIQVVSVAQPQVLLSENFDSGSWDTNQWQSSNAAFETGAADASLSVVNGQFELVLTATGNYWGGASLVTRQSWAASAIDPLVFELDRVANFSAATGTRTAVWITDAGRSNFVCLADLSEASLGWSYNQRVGQSTDKPTGAGVDIPAFNGGTFDDGGPHHIKLVANGTTVKIYLDGVFGVEAPFPVSQGLRFEVGGYVRAEGDTLTGDFDNISIAGTPLSAPGKLTAIRSGANVAIAWTGDGTLQSSVLVTGSWSDVTAPSNPLIIPPPDQGQKKFYRLR
jgi:hypothetical protein